MSNRREKIKKSLGITEYPWSSDDEENTQNPESVSTTSGRQADTTNISGTTGPPDTSVLAPRRRVRTQLEKDLFYSFVNNPTASSAEPTPGPSRPVTSSLEPTRNTNCTELANLQHIIAINNLSRSASPTFPTPNRYWIHPAQRGAGSLRHTGSTPTMQADTSGSHRTGRIKRKSVMWSRYGITRFRNNATQRDRSPEFVARSPVIASPSDSTFSDDDNVPQPRSIAAARELDIEVQDQDQNNTNGRVQPVENTSANRVSETVNVSVDADMPAANTPTTETIEDVVEIIAEENQIGDVSNHAAADGDVTEHAAVNQVSGESSRAVRRKREGIEENEPCTVKDFNQNLLQLLECPVCLEWMEPPMSQCRRGHLVCGRCRTRLSACPVCRTAFSSVRNRAMEGVAELLRYPCRHGCGRETPLTRRGSHEASCPSRRYRCPAPPCAERAPLPLADMSQHFQTKHLPILKIGRKHQFLMKINMEQHDNWLVMVARDLFHLRVDVDIRTWGVVVYVAYIGPKCNANNYTYEVTILGRHNERKLVYSRVTHSDLESASLNISRQDCFHLTLDQALNFLRYKNRHCEPDKFLEFTVEIKKLDVPVVNPRDDSDT